MFFSPIFLHTVLASGAMADRLYKKEKEKKKCKEQKLGKWRHYNLPLQFTDLFIH